MKIIGQSGGNEFVAIISHEEIEKVFNKYYGKYGQVNIGDVINMAGGHDFRAEIVRACEAMTAAMAKFDDAKSTMMKFAIMVAQTSKDQA